ncbi:hypothetical protein SDC9_137999 [bioreactor metagenome]|uniref:Uncharacterized protein n=1 Tax=bioreactor metagenome TaxID=1076179 RepID=A0A645DNK1_9ZZZZ
MRGDPLGTIVAISPLEGPRVYEFQVALNEPLILSLGGLLQ